MAESDLFIGRTVCHYRILEKLDGGGMGVVYRAEDVRLGRLVALKFLPQEMAKDRQALERFQTEARAASALDHPNICTIHDIGEHEGQPFMVMQLLDGKTLRNHISGKPMETEQVLEFGIQIAHALEAAHERGVIHRDIKPANIFVTDSGQVKLLDFGLAKLAPKGGRVAEANEASDQSASGTTEDVLTTQGAAIGTVPYMSPEQARGEQLDPRTDLFSFGAVLYEMATGERAFGRKTAVETLAAIIRDEPAPMSQLNPQVPPPLQWIVTRCLAKHPEDRYASARDLACDLAIVRDHLGDALLEAGVASRPHNLPIQRTTLIGRDKELSAAKELLLRKEVRLVTLIGPGGTGKTRLGLQVAEDVMEQFEGGVFFVGLDSIRDPGLIVSTIAQTLRVQGSKGRPIIEHLKEHLRDRRATLLILDNFEQVPGAAPLVAELLEASARVKILVTSRAVLHVYAEHEFPVPPLALADPTQLPSVETLAEYPAIALFLQRAVAVKPDFSLTSENARAVAEICARLDGLPLAIELAAPQIKLLPPAAMLARLQNRLRLSGGGPRDVPERQQTLRGTFDWSYELLSAEEQQLFRRLSVFIGGCTLEAAEAVCNAKNDMQLDHFEGMRSLVDKSLLQQVEQAGGEPRFRMLETIREYGMERLAGSGEEAATRRAHAAYCLVLAEEGGPQLISGPEQANWLERFHVEYDNYRAALDWLTHTGNVDWGLRMAMELFHFWEIYADPAEGQQRISALLRLPGAAARTKTRARALFAAGILALKQGDSASALLFHEEALEIHRKLGDQPAIAATLNALAVLNRDLGKYEAAGKLFEESLRVWQELDDPGSAARTLSNLADILNLQGDLAAAGLLHKQCQSAFKALGDRVGMAWSLNHQGDLARAQGDAGTARRLYEEALPIFRELDDRVGIASSLSDLGNLAHDEGEHGQARSLYAESLRTSWEAGQGRDIPRLLEEMARCAAAQGGWERVLKLGGAAAALRQRIGAPASPTGKATLDSSLDLARRRLESVAATTAWMHGWAMSLQQAVEYALAAG